MKRPIEYKARATTTRIIIHDSHTPPEIGQVEEVSRWHLDAHKGAQRMGLMSIGYHFIIERDGSVVSGRDIDRIGSHTPGHNMDSIGICWVGGRDPEGEPEDNLNHTQRDAMLRLCVDLMNIYGNLKVFGHSELQRYRNPNLPKCPYMDIGLFREDLKLYKELGITL